MTARIIEVSDLDYYADRIPGIEEPTMSASIAKTLVMQSPEHAYREHPRLGGKRGEPSTFMDLGNVLDALVLCDGKGLLVIDAADYRAKGAQEQREKARAEGLTPVLASKFDEAKLAAAAIRGKLEALDVRLDGRSQVVVLWQEETAVGPIWCRGKLDHFREREGEIFDLKTTSGSAHPAQCAKNVFDRGYDIQAAAYTSAVERVAPRLIGRVSFTWLFAEVNDPFPVVAARPSGQLRELGRRRWRRACETWARCLREKCWPSYSSRVETLDAPPWALREESIEL